MIRFRRYLSSADPSCGTPPELHGGTHPRRYGRSHREWLAAPIVTACMKRPHPHAGDDERRGPRQISAQPLRMDPRNDTPTHHNGYVAAEVGHALAQGGSIAVFVHRPVPLVPAAQSPDSMALGSQLDLSFISRTTGTTVGVSTQRCDPQRKGSALPELETPPQWRKSSFSGEGDCLEWAIDTSSVRLRLSRNRAGSELVLNHSEWAAFVAGVKRGEADIPNRNGSVTEA